LSHDTSAPLREDDAVEAVAAVTGLDNGVCCGGWIEAVGLNKAWSGMGKDGLNASTIILIETPCDMLLSTNLSHT
jgi:hypothetical protein